MSPPSAGETIIFYDGVCGLCNRLNQFVVARDPNAQFRFAALQSSFARETLGRHGRNPEDLNTLYLLEGFGLPSERLRSKSDAALRVLDRIGGVWKLSRIIAWLPKSLRDLGYDLVAKTRYRIFGKTDHCRVPSARDRARFIEYE
ncbi:MAG TPA: DCC1-like thiol-disulfide oxidoreductase family protein [Thermoanaerobaculia bacterium]